METVFLVLGLVLALVLWDLGRRRFDHRGAEDRFAILLRETEDRFRSFDQRILDAKRVAEGRAPTRAVAPFGPTRK